MIDLSPPPQKKKKTHTKTADRAFAECLLSVSRSSFIKMCTDCREEEMPRLIGCKSAVFFDYFVGSKKTPQIVASCQTSTNSVQLLQRRSRHVSAYQKTRRASWLTDRPLKRILLLPVKLHQIMFTERQRPGRPICTKTHKLDHC